MNIYEVREKDFHCYECPGNGMSVRFFSSRSEAQKFLQDYLEVRKLDAADYEISEHAILDEAPSKAAYWHVTKSLSPTVNFGEPRETVFHSSQRLVFSDEVPSFGVTKARHIADNRITSAFARAATEEEAFEMLKDVEVGK